MAILPDQLQAQAALVEEFDAQVALDQQTQDPATDTDPPAPDPAPAPAAPPAEPPVDWEQRFKSLQGKFNAEVPALTAETKRLAQELAEAKAQPPAKPEPTAPVESKVTAQDAETFGPELIDLVQRILADASPRITGDLQGQLDGLKSEIAKLKGDLGGVADTLVMTNKEKFLAALTAKFGDLSVINADQRFLDWCELSAPGTGTNWQHLLNEAFNAMDLERASELLTVATAGWAAPTTTEPAADTSLEDQVQPARTAARTELPADATERVFSHAEVEQLYRDFAQKKIVGAERVALEAEINRAAASGRVR